MTRVSEAKRRCRRIVPTSHGEFVVELHPDGLLMRPLRSRRGSSAEIKVPWGRIYLSVFAPPQRRRVR